MYVSLAPIEATEPIEAAYYYSELGWAVFPCHSVNSRGCTCGKSSCHSPGKHPLTRNGVKDAIMAFKPAIYSKRGPHCGL